MKKSHRKKEEKEEVGGEKERLRRRGALKRGRMRRKMLDVKDIKSKPNGGGRKWV